MDIPALPFCRVSLKGQKPIPKPYPRQLKTLGDHLRKKRLDLKLLQKEVALILGVDETTIDNWENNHSSPRLRHIPGIIKFLGYVPFDTNTKSLGEKIVRFRRLLGITQKELAKTLGVDPSTLGRWEKGRGQPMKRQATKLATFLASPCSKARDPEE
jgi:transcriptional regulator with XRE-family HTH domain